jgi:hypothetical protein
LPNADPLHRQAWCGWNKLLFRRNEFSSTAAPARDQKVRRKK